jgi:hypothetical protein
MTGDSASRVIEKSKSDTQEACEVTEKVDHVPATEDHDEGQWGWSVGLTARERTRS